MRFKFREPPPQPSCHRALRRRFGTQANVIFATTRKLPVQVATNLLLIVTAHQPKEDGTLRHHLDWDKLLVARDPTADINVIFMPWGGSNGTQPSRILGQDGTCYWRFLRL